MSANCSPGVCLHTKNGQAAPCDIKKHKRIGRERLLSRNSALPWLWNADSRQCNVFYLSRLVFCFILPRHISCVLPEGWGRQAGWQVAAAAPVQRWAKRKGNTKLTFKPRQVSRCHLRECLTRTSRVNTTSAILPREVDCSAGVEEKGWFSFYVLKKKVICRAKCAVSSKATCLVHWLIKRRLALMHVCKK